MKERTAAYKEGLKAGIPIALGYFAVSFTFGLMAAKGGLHTWEAALISLTNLTSAGQFAGLDIILTGGSLAEIALNQLIINLRYILMGFTVSQKLDRKYPFFHRFFMAYGITDEIFAISAARPGKLVPFFNYGAMTVAVPGWVCGTIIGALAGQLLPAIVISALSVAIYGMFIAIVVPATKKNHALVWVVVAAMALGAVFKYAPGLKNISGGFAIIIITVVVSAVAALIRPVEDEENTGRMEADSGVIFHSNNTR